MRQPKLTLVRSQSECQLRDKEFYEMCDDEDEVVLYCKMADQIHEQTIMDQVNEIQRNSSQNDVKNLNMGQNNQDLSTQQRLSALSKNNQLVFMSKHTFEKMFQRYIQEQKTPIGPIGASFANKDLGNVTGD